MFFDKIVVILIECIQFVNDAADILEKYILHLCNNRIKLLVADLRSVEDLQKNIPNGLILFLQPFNLIEQEVDVSLECLKPPMFIQRLYIIFFCAFSADWYGLLRLRKELVVAID
ncbi:MAG: hypothetical protein A4E43_01554 [Methanosaeta sp. PtaB.Bin005]|nr:MAG: hypothetical protein A4E43_01554 [Methanosaeta sp. PtaB.Bin005]